MSQKARNRQGKAKKRKKTTGKRTNIRLLAIGCALFAFLLYANTLGHDYAFDDFSVIKENYVVKQGMEGISTLLTTHYRYGYWNTPGTLYRPLSLVLFAVEWEIAPDQAWLSHLINVLLYSLTIALLFYTLFRMLGPGGILYALFITLLFAAHPLHTEVVANIKSRDEILSVLFSLLTLYSLFRYLSQSQGKWLATALFSFTLAMFSKESSITYFAVILFAIYFFRDLPLKRLAGLGSLFLAPIALYLLARSSVIGNLGGLEGQVSMLDNLLNNQSAGFAEKTATAIKILGLYLWKMLIPYPLVSDMGYNQIPLSNWSDWRVLLSAALWLSILLVALRGLRNKSPFSFAAWYLLATISIFSNLIIMIGSSYGERFLYGPSLGVCFALAFGILHLAKLQKTKSSDSLSSIWQKGQKAFFILGPILLIYSFLTIQRNPDWKDSFSIYQADVSKSPNCAKAHYHYGLELVKKGVKASTDQEKQNWLDQAHQQFGRSLEIHPAYGDAYAQLGLNFYRRKQYDKAMENYQKALEYKPNNATAYNNMGIIFFENRQMDKAKEVYEKAVKLDPRYVDALRNLGVIHAVNKEFDSAITYFEQGLQYEPNNATLLFYIGSAYKDKGQPEKGESYLQRAYALNPGLRKE
jgi:tetratricopeptide (TPR) repeat protein